MTNFDGLFRYIETLDTFVRDTPHAHPHIPTVRMVILVEDAHKYGKDLHTAFEPTKFPRLTVDKVRYQVNAVGGSWAQVLPHDMCFTRGYRCDVVVTDGDENSDIVQCLLSEPWSYKKVWSRRNILASKAL